MPKIDDRRSVRPYAGLTRYDEPVIPADVFGHGSSMRWWAEERGRKDGDQIEMPETGLQGLIDTLPRAIDVNVGWEHPVIGEIVPTKKHNAIVDPVKAERIGGAIDDVQDCIRRRDAYGEEFDTREAIASLQAKYDDADFIPSAASDLEDLLAQIGDSALYFVPTSEYTVVNPATFLRPLVEVLKDQDLDDAVFGEARLFKGGGKASMDVFFDGIHVEYPGDSDDKPIVLGLQIDWDHQGGTRVQAQGMGMDWNCTNAIRQITDAQVVQHAGDVDARVDWREMWTDLLETLGLKADQLARMIEDAMNENLDITDFPDDFAKDHDSLLVAFYEYAGLPGYLAKHAARNVQAEAADPYNPTWWDLHSGATYAITEYTNADVCAGGAINEQYQIANDMMMNPARTMEDVNFGYREAVEEDSLAEQGGGRAEIATLGEDVMEAKEQFEEREDVIRRLARVDA